MPIIQGLLGMALLAFGRKGLGLLLGALGFIVGMTLTQRFFDTAPTGVVIAMAVLGGVIGVFIAFFVQKFATVLVGVLGGGYVGLTIVNALGWHTDGFPWIPVAVFAVIGVLLAFFLLKWALIVLSSLVGAYLVVGAFSMNALLAAPLFVVLAIAGIWFQSRSDSPKPQSQE